MTPGLQQVLDFHEKYQATVVDTAMQCAVELVRADGAASLSELPWAIREKVIDLGLDCARTGTFGVVCSAGSSDLSHLCPRLAQIVQDYLRTVPVGEYIRWR